MGTASQRCNLQGKAAAMELRGMRQVWMVLEVARTAPEAVCNVRARGGVDKNIRSEAESQDGAARAAVEALGSAGMGILEAQLAM